MRDRVYVVGHGKLASSIQQGLQQSSQHLQTPLSLVDNWDGLLEQHSDSSQTVIVHCGSGRQLPDVLTYCQANHVPLVQCATGITYPAGFTETSFPLVDAPNLSLPIIKFLYLLEEMGPLFCDYQVSITESHQKTKTTLPGTAVEMARLLGVEPTQIHSIRDEAVQQTLGIPREYLDQHALHIIEIVGDECVITLKTDVHGHATYLAGLVRIITSLDRLPDGRNNLTALVRQRLL